MSREIRDRAEYESGSKWFADWHRAQGSDDDAMVDVDGEGYCRRCCNPLYMIEASRGRTRKVARVVARLAAIAGVPAFVFVQDIENRRGCRRVACGTPGRVIQMTSAPHMPGLFDEEAAGPRVVPAIEDAGLGQDARRTLRRQQSLELGVHPVTKARLHGDAAPADDRDAEGLRCRDCAHCDTYGYHRRTYVKCDAVALTHGPGSDTRRWYPACQLYTERDGDTPARSA